MRVVQKICNLKFVPAPPLPTPRRTGCDPQISPRHSSQGFESIPGPAAAQVAAQGNRRHNMDQMLLSVYYLKKLSNPHGKSVNNGIEENLCSLEYLRPTTERPCWQSVPDGPCARPLFAGVNSRLPFSLWLAQKIFPTVTDVLQWVLEEQESDRLLTTVIIT